MDERHTLLLEMLRRRERLACDVYDEAARKRYAFTGDCPDDVRIDHHRASARWTEAQEALGEALRICALGR